LPSRPTALLSDGARTILRMMGSRDRDYGTDSDDFIAISAGGDHSLALQRVCRYVLHGDLNDDCEVDFDDFALMAENWLIDCHTAPLNPACVPK